MWYIIYRKNPKRNIKMKSLKIIISALMAVCILICVSACGKSDTEIPKGMQLVQSDFVDAKLFVPEEWTPDVTQGFLSAYVQSDKSSVSLTAMTGTKSYSSFNEYLEVYLSELESTYAGYEYIASESRVPTADEPDTGITLGGVEAARIVFKIKSGELTYKYMQIIASHGYIYTLTYTALEDKFDSHTEEINKIISEFKFTK